MNITEAEVKNFLKEKGIDGTINPDDISKYDTASVLLTNIILSMMVQGKPNGHSRSLYETPFIPKRI